MKSQACMPLNSKLKEKFMNMRFVVFIVFCAVALHVVPAVAVDFPGRQKEKYKDMQWIEIDELHQIFLDNKVTIVDVRSKLEYETIHAKGAVHISVAKRNFESELNKLVSSTPGKKTAFY